MVLLPLVLRSARKSSRYAHITGGQRLRWRTSSGGGSVNTASDSSTRVVLCFASRTRPTLV